MACGCSSPPTDSGETRTKAARCHLCVYAEHLPDALNDGAVSCTVNGKAVVGLRVCPIGYFDEGPYVRWLGLQWIGLPAPLRWFLFLFKRSHPMPSMFDGCGCLRWLKMLFT